MNCDKKLFLDIFFKRFIYFGNNMYAVFEKNFATSHFLKTILALGKVE